MRGRSRQVPHQSGNVGTGRRRDEQFATICKVARDHDRPVRIGVNGGSLNQELVVSKMQENTDKALGRSSEEILNECMVISALQSTELAIESGFRKDQIIISCKVSRPGDLVAIYRDLARRTDQPLHLGLTEAGMGMKGLVWSSAAMAILLNEGIGDTIRVSLTPRPGGDRRDEVYAACELLQALGLRSFAPSVTACPGCGRTTSSTFQELAERTQDYIREQMPVWKKTHEGVETLTLAVMGCVVNGPGESKAANIGISLPGTGEAPHCPVFVDGEHFTTLRGTYDELAKEFRAARGQLRGDEVSDQVALSASGLAAGTTAAFLCSSCGCLARLRRRAGDPACGGGAGFERAFHVAHEAVARMLAGKVRAADALAQRRALRRDLPGAGNEYEPFVHASPGQSMKRACTKLGRMPRYIFSSAATWCSMRDAGRHSRHCSAAGPPENATSAAPAPGWPSVPSHVMWNGPSVNESGARLGIAPEPVLQRDQALHVRSHLRHQRHRAAAGRTRCGSTRWAAP